MFGKLSSTDQKRMLAISFDAEATAAMFAISTKEQQAAIVDALAVHERLALFGAMSHRQRLSFLQGLRSSDVAELFRAASTEQRSEILELLSTEQKVTLFADLECEFQYSLVVLSSPESQVSILEAMEGSQQSVYLATFKPVEVLAAMFAALRSPEQRSRVVGMLPLEERIELLLECSEDQRRLMLIAMSQADQATLLIGLDSGQRGVMLAAMSPEHQAALLGTLGQPEQQLMLAAMALPAKVDLFVAAQEPASRQVTVSSVSLSQRVEMFKLMPREQHHSYLSLCDRVALLEVAIVHEELELVKALLANGLSPNQPGVLSLQPLALGALGSGYAKDMVSALVSAGATVNALCDESPLALALQNEHSQVAELLLQQASDEELWQVASRVPRKHPLWSSIMERCLEEHHPAPISQSYYRARVLALTQTQSCVRSEADYTLEADGRPLLDWAVYCNNDQLVRSLLGSSHEDLARQAQVLVKEHLGAWLHVSDSIQVALLEHVGNGSCDRSLKAARALGHSGFLRAALKAGFTESAHVQTSWFSGGRSKKDDSAGAAAWGVDTSFPPSVQSLCGEDSSPSMKYMEVEWIRAQDIDGFTGGKVQLPEGEASSLEPGLFGSLFYWSSMLCLFDDKAVALNSKDSQGLYTVRLLGGHLVQVDDWIPCVSGRPAFGSIGAPAISSLLVAKAMAKRLGSFEHLVTLNVLAEQACQAGLHQGLEHVAALPAVALADKLSQWGVATDFHGVVDAFWWSMQSSNLASSDSQFLRNSELRTAEQAATYFVSPTPDSQQHEHVLAMRIQLTVPVELQLRLQTVDGHELASEVLKELSPSVFTEIVIDNTHFVRNGSLMLVLEQAAGNVLRRNHMCVEFSSTEDSLVVHRSQFSVL